MDDREVSYLKRDVNDTINIGTLTRLIEANHIDEGFWCYKNRNNNEKYIKDYYRTFKLENYLFIKSLFKEFEYRCGGSYKKIDIAIVGGGNFFELYAINLIAQKYPMTPINLTIIDKNFWQANKFNVINCKQINKITLIKNDFFDELILKNDYDIICFSRCVNLTEQINWSEFSNQFDYLDRLMWIIKHNSNSVLGFIQLKWSAMQKRSIDFDKTFQNALKMNHIQHVCLKGFNNVMGEYFNQMSNLYLVKAIQDDKLVYFNHEEI